MNIDEWFQEETQIPTLPEIFYQFKEAVDDPNTPFEEIADIVSHDTGLTARMLKIVNSAFFGFSSEIDLKDRMRQHKTVVLYSEIYESKFDAARRDKGVESGEKGNPD